MNDRFKFRFWDKETQTMQKIPMVELRHRITLDKIFADDRVIFMQCTGLKDKNDKLIYEGDIVRLKAKNGMNFDYAVKYKNYCFILEYINGKLKGTKARNFAKQYAQPKILYEHGYMVIGNIYENKELLEEE